MDWGSRRGAENREGAEGECRRQAEFITASVQPSGPYQFESGFAAGAVSLRPGGFPASLRETGGTPPALHAGLLTEDQIREIQGSMQSSLIGPGLVMELVGPLPGAQETINDVIAFLEKRRRAAEVVRDRWSGETAERAAIRARELGVVIDDLRAGMHHGEADVAALIGGLD